MTENKNIGVNAQEENAFNLKTLYTMLVLNWQWVIFSTILCLALGYAYLRVATPIYETTAKMLVKDDESNKRYSRDLLANVTNLGIMSNSAGISNEMEILQSKSILEAAVRDLKLYTVYYRKSTIVKRIVYKSQALNVDLDEDGLDKIQDPIELTITRDKDQYKVHAEYFLPVELGQIRASHPIAIDKVLPKIPATIRTKVGTITIAPSGIKALEDDETLYVKIVPPAKMALSYSKAFSVSQSAKTTTIAVLNLTDAVPQRGLDFLNALIEAYNRQANDDKNEIAFRTEEFINGRLEKISAELGNTDGSIEQYKRMNHMIEFQMSASQTMQNANQYDQKLIDINTQIALLNNLSSYIEDDGNKYSVIPSNIGLNDASTTHLISEYNKAALERNRLLRTASEQSPAVKPLTSQLDELHSSIRNAMLQSKRTLSIQRDAIYDQYNRYRGQVQNSPEQQRVMTAIGRQQEVQTALYTMLLQKREENSISLAATADKGRLIDSPTYFGKVRPRGAIIMLLALIIGIGLPFAILFIIEYFKFKIEKREDIAKLTALPIIADVAVASEQAKTKADIVVHENTNNMMEEIFRSMRTNLQFMLSEGQKVIMTTSSNAGEGKTFCVSNLAISFALLGKKVILIGLDIRKPRLAELFEIYDHKHGITPLLTMLNPTPADLDAQIVNSGVNKNLDLLMAGPIPPNPSELVERKQLDMIFDMLKEKYDYILIDSAPVGLVTDSLQIARVSDVTMIVVRADYTPKDNILMIDDLAQQNKLKNVAIVLNGIDMSKKKHSYHYGYGKYGRYGHYGRTYKAYGHYGTYGTYGTYGSYSNSHYGSRDDNSVKK